MMQTGASRNKRKVMIMPHRTESVVLEEMDRFAEYAALIMQKHRHRCEQFGGLWTLEHRK